MKIEIYKRPGFFFSFSMIFPWILWFIAAYISHAEPPTPNLTNLSRAVTLLGLIAPFVVTLYLLKDNPTLKKDMLGRIFNFKGVKYKYFILTFFLILSSILVAGAISLLFGQSIDQFRFSGLFLLSSGFFPVWFLLIIAPILEELAWHTYGTDSLRSRFNLFKTSVLFTVYWCIWHLPLFLIKGFYNKDFFEEGFIYSANFFFGFFPLVLIINWIYYKANRNILLPVIFHISAVFFIEIFATLPISKLIQTALLVLFSILILVKDKKMFFTKNTAAEVPFKPIRYRRETKNLTTIIIVAIAFSISLYFQSTKQTIIEIEGLAIRVSKRTLINSMTTLRAKQFAKPFNNEFSTGNLKQRI